MKNPGFLSSSLPLAIISLLLLLTTIHGAAALNLIRDTCKKISESDPVNSKLGFCTTSLQAAPASQCATLRGLAMISIRLLRYNVTDTRCHIKHMLKNKKWDRYDRMRLDDCFELYSDAIPTAKQAMKDFNANKYDDANTKITGIMDGATTCEDGFKEMEKRKSPLTKRNGNTFQMGAIALALLKMAQTGSSDCHYYYC